MTNDSIISGQRQQLDLNRSYAPKPSTCYQEELSSLHAEEVIVHLYSLSRPHRTPFACSRDRSGVSMSGYLSLCIMYGWVYVEGKVLFRSRITIR